MLDSLDNFMDLTYVIQNMPKFVVRNTKSGKEYQYFAFPDNTNIFNKTSERFTSIAFFTEEVENWNVDYTKSYL